MCLSLNKGNDFPRIAEKDIVCFKMIRRWDDELHTFFQSSVVVIGETYESEIYVTSSYTYCGGRLIHKALHSYKFLKDLRKTIKYYYSTNNYTNIVIVRCIIPKGSTYYLGDFEGQGDSYASNKLYYQKIIK